MSNLSSNLSAQPGWAPAKVAGSSPEFELLLLTARIVPDTARIEIVIDGGINWRGFLELTTWHAVRLLVYKTLRAVCWERVPRDIQAEWQDAYRTLTGKNLFLVGEMLRITREFQENGIPIAVLKGAVIAEVAYGDLALREFNDLDLLVGEGDFSRAVELCERLGYKPFWKYDNGKVLRFLRHMGEYKLINNLWETEIDLHWKMAHDSVALSPQIDDFPAGFQPIRIGGSEVLSLAPQDLPLYLASQGGGDQWGDLRRICDLAEFVRAYPVIDWEPHLKTARRLGAERSMLTGLALASRLLGADLSEAVVDRVRGDATVAELAERTVQNLIRNIHSQEGLSRYFFQMKAKQGALGKISLACSILTDRSAEDGSWIMLPRPLWWMYAILRPLRLAGKVLG